MLSSSGLRHRRVYLRRLGLSLAIACLLGSSSASADRGDDKAQAFRAAASSIAAAAGPDILQDRIEVWGTVLDADTGQPIRDVHLKAAVSHLTGDKAAGPGSTRQATERRTVDGAFHFQCQDCVGARLRFFADGYRSHYIDVHAVGPAFGTPPQSSTVEVRLEPAGERVSLRHIRGRLTASALAEKSRVLVIEPKQSQSLSPVKARNAAEKSATPLPLIQLVAGTDAAGQLKTAPGNPGGAPSATSAHLDFGPNGGVIVVPTGGRPGPQVMREMREAPAGGYASVLTLDPGTTDDTYVYIRLGTLYGRGYVTAPALEETADGPRLVASIEIQLNPDGGRGLETWE
ncbi:MAG: hypothetical protein AAFY88_19360 [Acidobacteriota bacterium]